MEQAVPSWCQVCPQCSGASPQGPCLLAAPLAGAHGCRAAVLSVPFQPHRCPVAHPTLRRWQEEKGGARLSADMGAEPRVPGVQLASLRGAADPDTCRLAAGRVPQGLPAPGQLVPIWAPGHIWRLNG